MGPPIRKEGLGITGRTYIAAHIRATLFAGEDRAPRRPDLQRRDPAAGEGISGQGLHIVAHCHDAAPGCTLVTIAIRLTTSSPQFAPRRPPPSGAGLPLFRTAIPLTMRVLDPDGREVHSGDAEAYTDAVRGGSGASLQCFLRRVRFRPER